MLADDFASSGDSDTSRSTSCCDREHHVSANACFGGAHACQFGKALAENDKAAGPILGHVAEVRPAVEGQVVAIGLKVIPDPFLFT